MPLITTLNSAVNFQELDKKMLTQKQMIYRFLPTSIVQVCKGIKEYQLSTATGLHVNSKLGTIQAGS